MWFIFILSVCQLCFQNEWAFIILSCSITLGSSFGKPWQRITIHEILEDEWFKKGYKRPEFDEKYDTTLDDVDAVFNDSEVSNWCVSIFCLMHNVTDFSYQLVLLMLSAIIQEHHVTEKKEEEPVALNAFELISMSAGLNLGNLFDSEQVLDLDVPDSSVVT